MIVHLVLKAAAGSGLADRQARRELAELCLGERLFVVNQATQLMRVHGGARAALCAIGAAS